MAWKHNIIHWHVRHKWKKCVKFSLQVLLLLLLKFTLSALLLAATTCFPFKMTWTHVLRWKNGQIPTNLFLDSGNACQELHKYFLFRNIRYTIQAALLDPKIAGGILTWHPLPLFKSVGQAFNIPSHVAHHHVAYMPTVASGLPPSQKATSIHLGTVL